VVVGAHLKLEPESEGWFSGTDPFVLRGTIEADVASSLSGGRWYLVRLTDPLELRESGHETPSGYRLVRYGRLLLSARHRGVEVASGRPVSTYVCLLPDGEDPSNYLRSAPGVDAWASCTITGA
jgi:hypothetical protein